MISETAQGWPPDCVVGARQKPRACIQHRANLAQILNDPQERPCATRLHGHGVPVDTPTCITAVTYGPEALNKPYAIGCLACPDEPDVFLGMQHGTGR